MRIEKTRSVGWKAPEDLYQAILRQANIDGLSFSEMLEICAKLGLKQYKENKSKEV